MSDRQNIEKVFAHLFNLELFNLELINRPRRKRTGYGKRFAPECQIRIAIPKLRRRAAGNTSPTRFNLGHA